MMSKIIVGLFVIVGLQACSPVNEVLGIVEYIPAIRINVSPESHAELQQVVASSLGYPSVKITKKALTKNPILYFEKSKLLGFDLDKPTVFKLLKYKQQCILLDQKKNKYYKLNKVECIS